MKTKLKNWDFEGGNIHFMTHGLHTYPARMIPQIAENLIKTYGKKNSLILDPFCGSGGVLAEATRANLNSVGLDINPLACLISRVKSTPINPSKLSDEWENLRKRIGDDLARYNLKQFKPELPDFGKANIEYWFKPCTIDELAIIKNHLDSIKDEKVRDFFFVCFSNTVRLVSGTRKGEFKLYRMPPEKWELHEPEVFKTFAERVQISISKMGGYFDFIQSEGIEAKAQVFHADTRHLFDPEFPKDAAKQLQEGSVGLILTSPPYGDSHTTVAYGQFSRYSLVWLGYSYEEALEVDKNSIGGKRNGTTTNSPTLSKTLSKIHNDIRKQEVLDFFVDLKKCLTKLERVLANGGYACFVLGNRTVSGIKVESDQILVEFGEELGLEHAETIYRNIPNKRMPWKSSPTNIAGKKVDTISKESIVILHK